MKKMELKGKRALVVGLARSGLAAANFLLRQGALVTITDLKDALHLQSALEQLEGTCELRLGGHDQRDFLGAELIVVSPGVSVDLPDLVAARQHGIPVLGEVELAFRFLKGQFIGVTGSNGKTTTTALIGALCRAGGYNPFVAGNIGRPLTEALLRIERSRRFVVELSSFQLESIAQFRCYIAVFLNLSPDHLDRHGNTNTYLAAKQRIFLNQKPNDWAVLNADDPLVAGLQTPAARFFFSRMRPLEVGAFVSGGILTVRDGARTYPLLPVVDVPLRGEHNLSNSLAAISAAFLGGVAPDDIADGIRKFRGVEHRLEFVAEIRGVEYYNDSKATNVDSAEKAIEAFSNPIVLIMGGLDKGSDFTALRDLVSDRVRCLLLIGRAAGKIGDQLAGAAPMERADSLEAAVDRASTLARPGDVVLLSPACASFDMFQDFEHRGRAFKSRVMHLAEASDCSSGGEAR